MAAVQRLPLEVDGRRVSLGLPAGLLRRFVSASTGTGADDGFDAEFGAASTAADAGAVTAPMAGQLQSWSVAEGSEVREGDTIAVLEAMKMEMQVLAHRAGRLSRRAEAGRQVGAGEPIASID